MKFDPAVITSIGAAVGVLAQGIITWRKNRDDSGQKLDEVLDARLMREFQRMESEIQELRDEAQSLRNEAAILRARVSVLEAVIKRHDIPLP